MSSKPSAVLLFAILACVAFTAEQAFGQAAPDAGAAGKTEYSFLPVIQALRPIDPAIVASNEAAAAEDTKRARARNMAYSDVRKVLAGQILIDEGGKEILDKYYKGYFLPNFTMATSRGELPESRNKLLKDLRSARSSAAVAYIRGQVMTYMKAYAQSPQKYNFHPAVRYNAMLVIGGLNDLEYGARYGDDERKAFVPHPLPQALDLLISEFKSPTQIDAVRVAALVGIDRHVKLDLGWTADRRIPGTKKKVIVDEMIALLNAAPPAGRTAAGHTWMQRRAIDILAAFGMVGAYPAANAAIEKIVMDNDAPISLRCTASEALAQWAPNSRAKIDASTVSRNLGLIAVKACTDELERIAALELREKEMKQLRELIKKPNPVASGQFGTGASGGSGMDMEMYGGGEGYGGADGEEDEESMYGGEMEMFGGEMEMYGGGIPGGPGATIPTDPRIVWSQRRLKYQLTCVKHGLDGMAIAGKASQHEKAVDQVAKAVEVALSLTDPPEDKPDLEGLAESIRKGVSQLAFLAPEAADPLTELPAVDPTALPGEPAIPAVDPTAPPAEPAVPAVDPDALPADAALPAGVE